MSRTCERCAKHRISMITGNPSDGFELACRDPESGFGVVRLPDALSVLTIADKRGAECGVFEELAAEYARLIAQRGSK